MLKTAEAIYTSGWATQQAAGIDLVPVNDFSLYDQMLDTAGLLGLIPTRYGADEDAVGMETYFAMARGRSGDHDVPAMEMTKWFDTNYHYIVPEVDADSTFRLNGSKPFVMLEAAQKAGSAGKVVLVGPVTFLALAKSDDDAFDPLTLLDRVLPVYAAIVS